MGSTSEDYLDSLLRAAMEPVSKAEKVEEDVIEQPVEEDVIEQPVEDTYTEINQDEQLSADDMAALFSSEMESETESEPVAEETVEEFVEEQPVIEENPLSVDEIDAMIAALDTEPEPVEIPMVMPVDDNPNKQLSPNEIAAMFAAASGEATVEEPVVEEPAVEEPAVEETPIEENVVEENPLSVDEIDAMIAALDAEPEPMADSEPVAEAEPIAEPEPVEIPMVMPIDDNPNKQLSPDEIAAMFAAASGETVAEESTSDSLDDLLALADSDEEMEIDLDNIDDLDALLGLREMPEERHWDEATGQMVEGKAEEVEELPELDAESGDMDDLAALVSMTGEDVSTGEEIDDLSALSGMMGTEDLENQDLSDLLSMLGDEDGDLAEIGDLLQKSDNHEIVEDDEMLALLGGLDNDATAADDENASQETAELLNGVEAEEKPKKKLFGRKKKEKKEKKNKEAEAASAESELTEAESEKKPKEKGFFGKLFEALTEEVEDEEELLEAAIESEGLPMDKKAKNKKKKDKKNKKEKAKAASNDEILEEMDEEDAANAKGKKKGGKGGKTKKPKKPKKEKEPVVEEPGKKLPKKMIIRIFVLCFSLLAVLILVTVLLPHIMQMSHARKAFYQGKYEEAYQGLVGKDLNESDQILLNKSEILLQLERKTDAYLTYSAMDQKAEALNALFEGVAYYWEQEPKFVEYGILDEANAAYAKILILLQDEYQIKEETAKEIIAMDSIEYTYTIRKLANGEMVMEVQKATESDNGEEEPAEPLEDLLEDEQ